MKKDNHFLFYSSIITDGALVLDSFEVAHISQVLRFNSGDEILVTDGKGVIYSARIEKLKRDRALCSIIEKRTVKQPQKEIILYVGIPDREKFEQLSEYMPPLGVSKIIPIIVEHTQRDAWWTTKWEKSLDRCNKKVIASIKQSFNPYITEISAPIEFKDAIALSKQSSVLFGDENGSGFNTLDEHLSKDSIAIFIGPPGGFSSEEITELNSIGAGINLGTYRLRTELAATVMVGAISQTVNK